MVGEALERRGSVLGTDVFGLAVGAEEVVWLVADLHLTPDEGERIAAFTGELAALPVGGTLVILGDLFDFWVGPKQCKKEGWRELVGVLRAEVDRGLEILLLWGNRDFQCDARFGEASGVRVVPGGLLLEREGGGRLLCLHGDELCQNDRVYQRAKRRLRSPLLRAVVRLLPFALARLLAGAARRRSVGAVSRARPEDLLPSSAALACTRDGGDQDLCFGHVHVPGCGALPGGGEARRYCVLPAWEAGGTGLARWSAAGELELLDAGAAPPWPEGPGLGP